MRDGLSMDAALAGVAHTPRRDRLTKTHVAIARLLAAGLEDSAVAARVHVSERTLRRYVRDLMTLLGARTRCALGARLAVCGWLNEGTVAVLRAEAER